MNNFYQSLFKRSQSKGLLSNSRFSTPQLAIFGLIFIGLAYLIIRTFAASTSSTLISSSATTEQKLLTVSHKLKIETKALKKAENNHNTNRINNLKPKFAILAKDRKALLKQLIQSDPVVARQSILSNDEQSTLAGEGLNSYTEKTVNISGIYGYKQISDATGDHEYTQVTTDNGKTYNLSTEQKLPSLQPGTKVSLSGQALDDQILINNSGISNSSNQNTALAYDAIDGGGEAPISVIPGNLPFFSSLGQLKTAVIMLVPSGSPTLDPNYIKSVFSGGSGSIASWVAENSSGKATFAPDFYGPYNLSGNCNSFDSNTAFQQANASADFSKYTRIMYVSNCQAPTFAGYATHGPCVNTNQGCIDMATTYCSYSNHDYFTFTCNAHELSHTLGTFLGHGGSYDCGTQVFVPPSNYGFNDLTCKNLEYDDPYDVLGRGSTSDLSTFHKLSTQWLDSTQYTTTDLPGATTYTLKPYENSSGLVALKVPRGNSGTFFTVEYRQPLGFDTALADINCTVTVCNVTKGALIHLTNPPSGGDPTTTSAADTVIIDNTPNSISGSGQGWTNDVFDAVLTPGNSFTDSDYGLTIKTLSADASGLTVQVINPPGQCAYNTPTVSALSPTHSTVTAGGSATYSITVTNTDSSSCGADQYLVYPAGFTYPDPSIDGISLTASPNYINLNPGQSKNITITASSSKTTKNGSYFNGFDNQSMWAAARPYGGQRVPIPSLNFQVTSPADSQSPSTPSNFKAKVLGPAAVQLSWSASSDNQAVCGYQIDDDDGPTNVGPVTSTILDTTDSTAYTATIQAYDCNINLSGKASTSFTTPALSEPNTSTDTAHYPSAIGNPQYSSTDHSYTLTWQPASDNTGIAYYIFQDAATNRDYYLPASQTSVTANNIPSQMYLTPYIIPVDTDGNWGHQTWITVHTLPESTTLPGDTNGDGHVTISDLSYLLSKWNTADSSADFNHDGTVGIVDLSLLLSHYGS